MHNNSDDLNPSLDASDSFQTSRPHFLVSYKASDLAGDDPAPPLHSKN
jgi:hypothetical protein